MKTFSIKTDGRKKNKMREEYKQSMEKHHDDVKKAIKIHKANEKLAKQNLKLKNDLKELQNRYSSVNIEENKVTPPYPNYIVLRKS